ncbi:DUF92 domain-containing protein [Parageobacillus thermoglucosidasius]|uniref:DUF92 domain-containing protein n=2 Tax=Anoxybacillaceae TaxID=3120669 RepID=A0AB38QY24_PARTM|nr:DUF92 domain-containing protein [Parageobacillus thermoglucosidasius]UOE75387.1 DUF92 domain-containing protein [Parageobacillus thermoglucosidasius]GCD81842.1 hypothetical protein PTHTG4_09040 [Parageobacillus thermoglucosidasius]
MTENEWLYVFASAVVAIGGLFVRSLSISGAMATVIVGMIVGKAFSWKGLMLLGVFFVSSSVWSKIGKKRKQKLIEKVEKGEQRDYIQVFANGGVAVLISFLAIVHPSSLWLDLFIISIAAANADTWASEIGSLSRQTPRLLTNFKKVEAGTSGAVTLLGLLASFLGAAFIGTVSAIQWKDISIITIAFFGWFGSLLDTLFGAVWQAVYRCPVCGIETERKEHCRQPTVHIKGCRFVNNDVVNALSIVCCTTIYIFFTMFR